MHRPDLGKLKVLKTQILRDLIMSTQKYLSWGHSKTLKERLTTGTNI